jgi:hypothetical protein
MNDWTFGYQLQARGKARNVCAGDTVFSPTARVIAYGRDWHGGRFSCTSRLWGLHCWNTTSDEGFFISRNHSYRFHVTLVRFRTPSGAIGCQDDYLDGGLRCDLDGGLKPRPPKPRSCAFEWAPGYSMTRIGRTNIVCGSDTVNIAPQRTLAYGQSWHRDGFTCKSQVSGLSCRNERGHGFFLSRQHSYRF